ncbi:MAG: EamA family transporter [Actinomycetota bacterium]|nr:EamA family transporter [Actinomycetota bacterium]
MTSVRRKETPAGLARVAIAATIWGSIPVLVRAVDTSSVVIVFWRVAFAGATLLLYLTFKKRLGEIVRLPTRRKLALMGMGALLTVNWLLFFTALQLTGVAVAVLLGYLGPVFVAAFTPLVAREPFDRRVVLPLALALGGTLVIVAPGEASSLGSPASMLGATLAFTSAITYAILVLNARRLVQGISASVYMVVEYSTAAVLLLPAAVLLPGPQAASEWGSLAALGVVNTALTGFLFLSALRNVRADHAAIITYAEPVSAVLFAAVFLGEPLTLATLLGGAAVIAGGIAVTRLRPMVAVEGPPVIPELAEEGLDGSMGNTGIDSEDTPAGFS